MCLKESRKFLNIIVNNGLNVKTGPINCIYFLVKNVLKLSLTKLYLIFEICLS